MSFWWVSCFWVSFFWVSFFWVSFFWVWFFWDVMLTVIILHVIMLSVLLNVIDDCSFSRVGFCRVSLCWVLFYWLSWRRRYRNQGILNGKVSQYSWPPVWLVCISLFCKQKQKLSVVLQLIPNQSNWRSTVQWYFPL